MNNISYGIVENRMIFANFFNHRVEKRNSKSVQNIITGTVRYSHKATLSFPIAVSNLKIEVSNYV